VEKRREGGVGKAKKEIHARIGGVTKLIGKTMGKVGITTAGRDVEIAGGARGRKEGQKRKFLAWPVGKEKRKGGRTGIEEF